MAKVEAINHTDDSVEDEWEAANRRGRAFAKSVIAEWRAGQCSPNRLRFTAESLKEAAAAGYWAGIAASLR